MTLAEELGLNERYPGAVMVDAQNVYDWYDAAVAGFSGNSNDPFPYSLSPWRTTCLCFAMDEARVAFILGEERPYGLGEFKTADYEAWVGLPGEPAIQFLGSWMRRAEDRGGWIHSAGMNADCQDDEEDSLKDARAERSGLLGRLESGHGVGHMSLDDMEAWRQQGLDATVARERSLAMLPSSSAARYLALCAAHALTSPAGTVHGVAEATFTFANCHNVQVVERVRQRTRQQRRHGTPEFHYKTLDIGPMTRVLEREGHIASNGPQKALHICRGYFAHHTNFFGRGEERTVFVPQHTRGSAEQGVTVKDYRVTPS